LHLYTYLYRVPVPIYNFSYPCYTYIFLSIFYSYCLPMYLFINFLTHKISHPLPCSDTPSYLLLRVSNQSNFLRVHNRSINKTSLVPFIRIACTVIKMFVLRTAGFLLSHLPSLFDFGAIRAWQLQFLLSNLLNCS
jgi:hypothetical protein